MKGKQVYKVAMVGLDMTAMDDIVLGYLPFLCKALPIDKIIFIHIAGGLDLPKDVIKKYPDLVAPVDDTIKNEIRQKVDAVEGFNVEYEIMVREGNPTRMVMRSAKIKNADLIVMGRKQKLEGSGLLANHLVRKSPCSIMLITENVKPRLENILIPVDFSSHSALTASLAFEIGERSGATLHFAHVYHVPMGYHKTGKSFDDFADIMKSHAAKDYQRFCNKYNFKKDCDCQYLLAGDRSIPHLIYDHASKTNTDLIVIGSRGRTRSSVFLLGSVVEKLVFKDSDIPVLVVKRKGENMGFYEALMKI